MFPSSFPNLIFNQVGLGGQVCVWGAKVDFRATLANTSAHPLATQHPYLSHKAQGTPVNQQETTCSFASTHRLLLLAHTLLILHHFQQCSAVVSFKVLMATTGSAGCDLQLGAMHRLQSVVSADLRISETAHFAYLTTASRMQRWRGDKGSAGCSQPLDHVIHSDSKAAHRR